MRRTTNRLNQILAEIQNFGPFADDIEQYVLSCAVYGTRQLEIFRELDEECFKNWSLYSAIKKQYKRNRSVSIEQLAVDTGVELFQLKKYFFLLSEEHLDCYIRILRQRKIQRAVVRECSFLIQEAVNNSCNVDTLLDKCADLHNKVINS